MKRVFKKCGKPKKFSVLTWPTATETLMKLLSTLENSGISKIPKVRCWYATWKISLLHQMYMFMNKNVCMRHHAMYLCHLIRGSSYTWTFSGPMFDIISSLLNLLALYFVLLYGEDKMIPMVGIQFLHGVLHVAWTFKKYYSQTNRRIQSVVNHFGLD